jgi:hypothetical protein
MAFATRPQPVDRAYSHMRMFGCRFAAATV